MSWQDVERLKVSGFYEQAGVIAYQLGYSDHYGAHYGMRSERDAALAAFKRGWQAAKEADNDE